LRERRSDILPLAEYFLSRYATRNEENTPGLTEEAVLLLQQHSFPGNVRELEHLMERAAVQTSGRAITVDQIGQHIAVKESISKPSLNLERLLQLPFHESVASWEKRLIENAILMAGGNKAEAARRLGIHRRLLYEKLQQFDMDSGG